MDNKDIQIVENVLNDYQYNTLLDIIKSPKLPWQIHPKTCSRDSDAALGQAVHIIFKVQKPAQNRSSYYAAKSYPYTIPILRKKEETLGQFIKPTRVKCNCTFPSLTHHESAAHTDINTATLGNPNLFSAIYYPEDSTGETIFYEEFSKNSAFIDDQNLTESFRYTPKANTMVVFHSQRIHRGCYPTENKLRRVINMVSLISDTQTVYENLKPNILNANQRQRNPQNRSVLRDQSNMGNKNQD